MCMSCWKSNASSPSPGGMPNWLAGMLWAKLGCGCCGSIVKAEGEGKEDGAAVTGADCQLSSCIALTPSADRKLSNAGGYENVKSAEGTDGPA